VGLSSESKYRPFRLRSWTSIVAPALLCFDTDQLISRATLGMSQ
jgi:hypothetical protein